jgi:hypothetical protein
MPSPSKRVNKPITPQQQEAIRRQARAELWKRSCIDFIAQAVWIEDKTQPTGISRFNLWPKQIEALQVLLVQIFVIILKARQLGLTWLVLAYALWKLLFNPGFLAIAISKRDDPDALELGLRMQFMLRYLPDWFILPKKGCPAWYTGLTWSCDAHEIRIHRPGGEDSRFLTLPASPDTAHSFTANLVILDEWALHPYDEEIWTGAFPTMNRPDFSGQVIGLSTGRRGTLFERMWNDAVQKANRFVAVFLNWRADPRRTEAWREQTKKDLPNTYKSQYPETPEDAFTVGEGAFFPQWDPEHHVITDPIWYPPEYCQLFRAYDAGFGSNACCKWYAVFPDGRAVAYREYYPRHVTDPEQAAEIKRLSIRPDGQPELIRQTFADPSCWNKQSSTGESTAAVFAKCGVPMSKADNDLSNGWRRLHQWLKPVDDGTGNTIPHLRFTYNCPNTIRTYPACEQSKTNPEDISLKSEHHPQDVDRYFVFSRPVPSKLLPFLSGGFSSRPPKDFDRERGRDRYEDLEDVADGIPGFYGI